MVVNILSAAGISSFTPTGAIWFDIGVIIIIATTFALIARLFKQPFIPAYVLGGILIGPVGLGLIQNADVITVFSEIGLAFLLFFAGLEISFKKLKDVVNVSVLAGLGQIIAVSLISFVIALAFSFTKPEAIFLALAIPFSSTAIVVKLLADKNELNTLHARIAIGMLLLQDIIAVIALTMLSTETLAIGAMIGPLFKVAALVLFAFVLSKTILKPIFMFASYSIELLFLSSIAICFLFALLALLPIFSLPSLPIVIGSFIAGVLLANSPFKLEIESRLLSLRDFFITIFFVSIGMQIVFTNFSKYLLPFICFAAVVIVIEPYISMVIISLFGYTKKTSFLAGLYQAQTSEFSLILMAQGLLFGYISKEIFSLIVLLTVVTMSITPFLIAKERFFFEKFSKGLDIFKRASLNNGVEYETKTKKEVVIFGCHRMGSIFLKAFSNIKKRVLVVDVDPSITKNLTKQEVPNIYGDMADPDILNRINLKEISLAISTVPDKLDNLYIIEKIKNANPKAMIFVTADFIADALELYKKGADYVVLPQVAAGEDCISLLKDLVTKKETLGKTRKSHIEHLQILDKTTYDLD